MSERVTTKLKQMIAGPGLAVLPGVADALNARLVASEGFDGIYMTGAGTSATRLGMPDVGLLTMQEMVDNAGRIADASRLPLLADADTGWGGPLNVRRTVQAYERAGVAGLHIEDQEWPKRCGHLAGKAVIPLEDMVAKIKAAVDARIDDDFQIVARTDALAVEGWQAMLDRANAFQEAGADVLFLEAMTTMEQLAEAPKLFEKPLLYNMASSGKTPFLPTSEIESLGFGVVIYPNFVVLAAIPAIQRTLRHLKKTGDVAALKNDIVSFQEFFDLMGMDEVKELEARYVTDETRRAGY
jgi:2-methylisocitrate lyase-like PEP mutase family enzyme